MREYWGSNFALDKYKGTSADTYIWTASNALQGSCPSTTSGTDESVRLDDKSRSHKNSGRVLIWETHGV